MWATLGIVIVAILIIMAEVPSLIKNKAKRELWVFSVLFVIGVGLSIARGLNVSIPNPLDVLIIVYKPLIDLLTSLLHS
ncbi:hypothetical protein [Rossellomorea aquimaris]|uniref:Uncharacterized protein n=1 Tax=Rossellomorea aquimaris TaxID=189382 RepID=A0A366EZG8_9BACI|nr:hypothetical protein [Rossellomorea aquimaris]RBP07801.1 hypothetical protein DET59_101168 [Rossellomorea aquimaris]